MKREAILLLSISIAILIISAVSAARMPIVLGDDDAWGTVLNDFLNISHNDSGELRTMNFTIDRKITFTLGEMIDNIVDGIISVFGNLRVEGQGNFSGTLYINNGTDITLFNETTKIDSINSSSLSMNTTANIQNLLNGTGIYNIGEPFWINYTWYVGLNTSYPSFVNISSILFVNRTSGNVGIGTASPRGNFEIVSGTANTNADVAKELTVVGPNYAIGTASQPANIQIATNDAQAINMGGSIAFGGRYTDASTLQANYASIKGGKTDSVSGNYGGYLTLNTRPTGNVIAERMRIDKDGNVGIGTTSPSVKLQVAGNVILGAGATNSTTANSVFYVNYGGTDANRYTVYWNSVAGNLIFVSSDERLKENIKNISLTGIEKIKALNPVTFNFKNNTETVSGFLAQDVIEVDPTLAWHWINETNPSDEKWGLNGWDGFAALLTKAIQEQQIIINNQQIQINDLKKALCSSSIKAEFVELCGVVIIK